MAASGRNPFASQNSAQAQPVIQSQPLPSQKDGSKWKESIRKSELSSGTASYSVSATAKSEGWQQVEGIHSQVRTQLRHSQLFSLSHCQVRRMAASGRNPFASQNSAQAQPVIQSQ